MSYNVAPLYAQAGKVLTSESPFFNGTIPYILTSFAYFKPLTPNQPYALPFRVGRRPVIVAIFTQF